MIISFVLSELVGSDLMRDVAVDLLENYPDGEPDVDLPRLRIEYTTFGQEFLYLPSVSGAVERLSGSNMCKVRREIASEMGQRASGSAVATVPHIETIRNSLSSLAGRLEYAESGEGDQFLRTAPLRVLAQHFTEIVPVAVVMGSKGAGKTYTYLQIVRSRVWSEFARQASALGVSSDWGLIWPLLHSRNLKQSANSAVVTCRQTASEALDMKPSLASTAVADLINESLRHSFDETSWRQRWFTNFAQALGLEIATENVSAGRIIEVLRQHGQNLIFLVDGLEDLFPELEKKTTQRTALRALLQGVPNYLREVPDSPVGILIFVRGDLARAAISQNFGQFSHLYEALALRWNEEEALRLAVWLANSAGLDAQRKAPETMAIDDANFLRYAAASPRNATATDRILAPRAIRDAILPCSREKIDEIKQEIPRLESIFAKLQSSTDRRIPFDAASSGLAVEEIRFLEAVGALVEDKGEYFMPEIFRLGLGFQLAEGKRPRVLGLARRILT